jgi:tetratricopeptide (TPR) repeat protein
MAALGVIVCAVVVGILATWSFWGGEPGAQPEEQSQTNGKTSAIASRTQPSDRSSQTNDSLDLTKEALGKEGIDVMTGLVRDFPDSAHSYGLMGVVRVALGNVPEAAKCFAKSIELDPAYSNGYRGLATLALSAGQFEKVVVMARKALDMDSKARGVRSQLGQALIALGRPKEATAVLQADVEISPRAGRSYFYLAQAYQQLGQYDKAKENYTAALRIKPDYTEACYGIAAASARLGQAEEAAKYRRKFKQMKAGDLKRLGSRRDGVERHKHLADLRRGVAQAHTEAATVYRDKGRFVKAEKHWRRAAVLAPGDTACRWALVFLYRKNGLYDKTIPVLEQLIGIKPNNANYHVVHSVMLAKTNRLDAALSAIKRAIQLDPNNPDSRGLYEKILRRKRQ